MNVTKKTRFVKEVAEIPGNNPHIDLKQIQEWQKFAKILEEMPQSPQPEAVKPPRLQPIPLHMFD